MGKINLIDYKEMIKILKSFAGSDVDKITTEGINRNIFVTNFINTLSKSHIEREEVAKSLNFITKSIVNYDIPIIDIYKYFGTNTMTIKQLENFFNNYLSLIDKRKLKINEIFSLLVSESENKLTSIGDILSDIKNLKNYKNNFFIHPKIHYSYKPNEKYFMSSIDASKTFYRLHIAPLENIDTTLITNNELKDFLNYLKKSFYDCDFLLYDNNNSKKYISMLYFLSNINLINKDTIDFNDIKELFQNNATISDKELLLQEVASSIYKLYAAEINKFQVENDNINLNNFIEEIQINELFKTTGTISSFIEYLFMVYIQKNTIGLDNINTYISDLKKTKEIIDAIYATILNDTRFERGE